MYTSAVIPEKVQRGGVSESEKSSTPGKGHVLYSEVYHIIFINYCFMVDSEYQYTVYGSLRRKGGEDF